METERSAEISALFDGELGEREAPGALRAARHDPSAWRAYSLIGASLRGEPVGTGDLTDRVMARLAEEPVVLAPRQLVA
ncbi:MAG: sigma-E factor negative regulatory protein, partial [Sulfuritalea sp.]|nr:sigma-E factor negative regulatory protein [Sulfuritalea sp.]